jgi:proline iminopeptidase
LKKYTAFIFFFFVFLWQASFDCRAQSADEGFITTSDGVRLFYKIVGSGPETLVAVHGGPGNSLTSIEPDLKPLANNRRIIYYDQRGNGRSDLMTDLEKLSISKHIEDLEAVRTHFKLDKMTLLGNSWGGLLLGYYAAAHPDRVERLVFHNPAPPTKVLISEMESEIRRRMNRMYNDQQRNRFGEVAGLEIWPKTPDPRALCREFYYTILAVYVFKPENLQLLKGELCSGPEEAIRKQRVVNHQIWRSLGDFNLLPSLSAVKAPVLVIHGAADVIPVKASEAWTRAMPDARLLIINEAGHIPQVEQPEIFFKAVETFLKGSFPADAKKVQVSPERVEK